MTELATKEIKLDHSALLREMYNLNIEVQATGNEQAKARLDEVKRLLEEANLL